MASSITWYDQAWKLIVTGAVDLDSDTLKVALVSSGYTPSTTHTIWDPDTNNAADPSYNEVTNGSGYTTGGATLANPVTTNANIDYDDVSWTALTKTFRYAVCYASKTVNGLVNPLLFYILLDTTPADIVSNGSNYTIQWNATNKVIYRPA